MKEAKNEQGERIPLAELESLERTKLRARVAQQDATIAELSLHVRHGLRPGDSIDTKTGQVTRRVSGAPDTEQITEPEPESK